MLIRLFGILWASPNTFLGLVLGTLEIGTGGRLRLRGGILEFYGGRVVRLLRWVPGADHTLAFTLGHTVFGITDAALDVTREHELVHVRQFERWGPFMLPAYFGCSLVLWIMGKNPYRDNPFEREAFEKSGG
jgi:hypothetical protein